VGDDFFAVFANKVGSTTGLIDTFVEFGPIKVCFVAFKCEFETVSLSLNVKSFE